MGYKFAVHKKKILKKNYKSALKYMFKKSMFSTMVFCTPTVWEIDPSVDP